MRKVVLMIVIILFFVALIGAMSSNESISPIMAFQHQSPTFAQIEIDPASLKVFQSLPDAMPSDRNPITAEKVALGRMLYFEPRLSKSGQISCNSCHLLEKYGVDNRPVSPGHLGQTGSRNSPTVYNAAGHVAQFWDGRAPDVEEQAKGPVLNPVEMAMPDSQAVVAVLRRIPQYVEMFKKAFPEDKDPVTYDNMGKAIGAFERKLVTPSRWDQYLKGDTAALTNVEKIGFNKYMETGCQMCHSGAYLGGASFIKLGAMKPWPDTSDLGRYAVTHQNADKMVFKVSSLRNVEMTGPYFHSGAVATLDKAVTDMAQYQLGKQLSSDDVKYIVAWMKTLTGELPAEYIQAPVLPPSSKAAGGAE